MKKTTLLLLFIWVLLNQTAANAYSQGITLSFKSAPLSTIFKEIEKQTSFDFIYPADELYARKVTITVTNAKLEEVMDLCLQGLPFTYSVNEKRIVVKKVEEKAPGVSGEKSEPIELTGRVVDENGKPVAGATVTVRGTSISTATEADGTFTIKGVDAKATIVVTNVGFEPQIVSLRGKTDLSIKLVVTAQEMKEVIISTGYQKVSAEKFVGSYSQLDSAAYHRRAGAGILERLDGIVPGLMFDKKANTTQIQIRGISTLGAGGGYTGDGLWKPLIVIDNFVMDDRFDINSINPNDVESITVLKDAAATSIWGARAGNGVIVVSTKRGKYNKQFQVSISSNITIINEPNLDYIKRISTSDFIDIERSLFGLNFYRRKLNDRFSYPVVSPVVEILNRAKNSEITQENANRMIDALRNLDIRNDLREFVYRKGIKQQHYLNLNGGASNINYSMSFGFNNDAPNLKGSKSNRQYTISAGTSYKPTKDLEIQTTINYSQSESRTAVFSLLKSYPYLKLADIEGNSLAVPHSIRTAYLDTLSNPNLLDWQYRPLDEIKIANNSSLSRYINVNVALNYKISDALNVNFSYQNTSQITLNNNYNSIESYYTRDLINRFYNPDPTARPDVMYPIPKDGILNVSTGQSSNYSIRGNVSFNKKWSNHQLTMMLGADASESKGKFNATQFYGYNKKNGSYRYNMDYFTYYPLYFASFVGNSGSIPNSTIYLEDPFNRIASFYGNISYTFDNRLTLYGSARKDGANVFGVKSNNKWKPLWSVGAKWQISNEKFFTSNWISSLALRGSYGFSGNVSNLSSGKLTLFYSPTLAQFTNYQFADPASPNNPDLRWEKVGQSNLALDFSIFNGRIGGSFDVFQKKSSDLIYMFPFDPTTGVVGYPINSASLRVRGGEFTINSLNIRKKVQWNSSISISYAKTIVTDVANGGIRSIDFLSYNVNPSKGKIAFGLGSYKWAGLDSLSGDPKGVLSGKESKDYYAIFNDSIDNQVLHGSAIPIINANILNSISWNNVTVSFNISGRFNYYFREPSVNINHTGEFNSNNYLKDYYNRWQKPGDERHTNVPSVLYPVPSDVASRTSFYQYSEIHVKRADNVRLQDLRMQYRWIPKGAKSTIKSAQIFLYANNLNVILWRKTESDWDPDFSGGGVPTMGPSPKTWTIGISLNF